MNCLTIGGGKMLKKSPFRRRPQRGTFVSWNASSNKASRHNSASHRQIRRSCLRMGPETYRRRRTEPRVNTKANPDSKAVVGSGTAEVADNDGAGVP